MSKPIVILDQDIRIVYRLYVNKGWHRFFDPEERCEECRQNLGKCYEYVCQETVNFQGGLLSCRYIHRVCVPLGVEVLDAEIEAQKYRAFRKKIEAMEKAHEGL